MAVNHTCKVVEVSDIPPLRLRPLFRLRIQLVYGKTLQQIMPAEAARLHVKQQQV